MVCSYGYEGAHCALAVLCDTLKMRVRTHENFLRFFMAIVAGGYVAASCMRHAIGMQVADVGRRGESYIT